MDSSSAISSNRVCDLVAIAVQIESPNMVVRVVHSSTNSAVIPSAMYFNSLSRIVVRGFD